MAGKPPKGSTCEKCGFLVGGYHCDCHRKPAQLSSVSKLVKKLRKHGYEIGRGWKFERCYPGHWMRAAGAWSWVIRWGRCRREIGSPDPVRVLLKAKKFHNGPYNEVYADDDVATMKERNR